MRNKKYIRYTGEAFALIMSVILAAGPVLPAYAAQEKDKTETVYVSADAEGNVNEVTVSDWLKNRDGSDTLEDYSDLTDIKNVKGDETFTKKSDGSLLWDAQGKDIYYQGKSSEELPVSVKISYTLDGQPISPEKLAGKSGKVTIRFDYENHAKETVKVKGSEYEIQTPFTMVSAMILPSDTFTNVQVKNGQVMADGDKNIVVGMAFPGLSDSLRLSDHNAFSEVSLPDYVEVTADVKDFSLSLTLTAAATGMLDETGVKGFGDADDLEKNMAALTDASSRLEDGCDTLLDGLDTLSDSFAVYVDGVSDADQGAGELKKGLQTLHSRKKDLTDGADDLQTGLKALKKGTKSLKDGIRAYTGGVSNLEEGLQTAGTGAAALENGADTLQTGIINYTDGAAALQKGIDTLYTQVTALDKVSLPDKKEMAAVKEAASKLEQDAKLLQQSAGAITEAMESVQQISAAVKEHNEEVKDRFATAKDALEKVDEKAAAQANEQLKSQKEAIGEKATAQALSQAKAAVDGQEALSSEEKSALKAALDNSINVSVTLDDISIDGAAKEAGDALGDAPEISLSDGNVNLSEMESLLSDMKTQAAILESFAGDTAGLEGLTDSLPTLVSGVSSLKSGADTLTENNSALQSGIKTLKEGLGSLSSGIATMQTGAAKLTGNNNTLNTGAAAADKGAGQLQDGSKTLAEGIGAYTKGVAAAAGGADQLADGTAKLHGAGSLLTDGIDQLVAGAATLSDGMTEFNDRGIRKISDLAGDDLQEVLHRMKAVKKADKRYDSFAGKKEDASGSVRFIIETGAVETEEGK